MSSGVFDLNFCLILIFEWLCSNPSRPAARPSPPSDDFSFDAAFTSSKPAQKAAPIPAPESEHKRKSSLTDFDNLFGTSKPAAPAAPVAPVAAPQASSAKGMPKLDVLCQRMKFLCCMIVQVR
jgi:hypothetical protein